MFIFDVVCRKEGDKRETRGSAEEELFFHKWKRINEGIKIDRFEKDGEIIKVYKEFRIKFDFEWERVEWDEGEHSEVEVEDKFTKYRSGKKELEHSDEGYNKFGMSKGE